jgi:predicted N-formylglutamate amidohydrolase
MMKTYSLQLNDKFVETQQITHIFGTKSIIITCEHGGNQIPNEYQYLFEGAQERLMTHQGWDIGALDLAKIFADKFSDFIFYSEVSRLLIELNRSLHSQYLFSDLSKRLNPHDKENVLAKYYFPYRLQVEETINKLIHDGYCVIHISVHSFTPVLDNEIRKTDLGLLYHPHRLVEKQFCTSWKQKINEMNPEYKIRMNYPYLGKADGFMTFLRKSLHSKKYIGFELEVNQKYFTDDKFKFPQLCDLLILSLQETLNRY